jgi:ribosome maturation factor RimP
MRVAAMGQLAGGYNGGLRNGPSAHFLFLGFLQQCGQDDRCLILAIRDDRKGDGPMTNEELSELLGPAIADLGLELVGIEFSPNAVGSLLRVYVDEPERGVTIDDCERASREISALLDVNDPVAGRYTLEVSSPGLERPLFTLEHFSRFVGHIVKVNVNLPLDGRRRFQGPIKAIDGDHVVIEQDGAAIAIAHANIGRARLVPDYAALGMAPARPEPEAAAPARRRRS